VKTIAANRRGPLAAAALVAAAALAHAPPTVACADGAGARGQRSSIVLWTESASWRPATARSLAVWLRRLDALVPEGNAIHVVNETVTCEGPRCIEPSLGAGRLDLRSAFDTAARLVRSPASEVARARGLGGPVHTVQVFAGGERGARAARDRVHAARDAARLDLAGFYEEGDVSSLHGAAGVPTVLPVAHIVRERSAEGALHRVVVGAHLTPQEAADAAATLRAAGIAAFPRLMPAGEAFEEPVFSSAG
jgi:hypothetical protein